MVVAEGYPHRPNRLITCDPRGYARAGLCIVSVAAGRFVFSPILL